MGIGDAPKAAAITLPKGGGAIRGIGETVASNPLTGTASVTVPIACSPGRDGFGPQLALRYDSGTGNGSFGMGWSLALPQISRKTELGLPRYYDDAESDVFLLSASEDLVPALGSDGAAIEASAPPGYTVRRYRPRIEGQFARIERWTSAIDGDVHWRSMSRDNVLTIYGADARSRVSDPADPRRVFSWLICESHDDRGNAIIYDYKSEDGAGADLAAAHERNRGGREDPRRAVNRYLKRIAYGNRASLLDESGRRPTILPPDQRASVEWLFELVFDYGEHDAAAPTPRDTGDWAYRHDPFSTYRAGFEVRTTRTCQRTLMFHHFPDEPGVGADCLVQSTDLEYADEGTYSVLRSVTRSGYQRQAGGYLVRRLPPIEYRYSQVTIGTEVRELDPRTLEHLPAGLDGGTRWIDLHGEGAAGILTQVADGWFYQRNLSPLTPGSATFGPPEQVASLPNAALANAQLIDLGGDGRPDLVMLEGAMAGFYAHDDAEGWLPFRPFAHQLNLSTNDPNLRFLDLNGDGHADLLITEDDCLVWHESLDTLGFGPAHRVANERDEERGPRLVFADETESIHLADLGGDGLADLVRIRNGEVCYWPNLGYGRFGSKITTSDAPLFDEPDQFQPRRLRLADIDGSGTADLVYLHRDGVQIYFNQSGNRWSAVQGLAAFPRIDDQVSIECIDLLGNGTACLVWSSPAPADVGRQMRYVDLSNGQKPHLLTDLINNIGAETHIDYAPSTSFYLQDKVAGTPWVTRLPFPIHVVARIVTRDRITGNESAASYTYHHGHFDSVEREFAGFAMIERLDLDPGAHAPPVLTRTRFHTGMVAGDAVLPSLPTLAEEREAFRALRGRQLREETYALDGTAREAMPYLVTEQRFEIRRIQPRGSNRHGVFLCHPREAFETHYERNLDDPRVSHALTLEVGEFGDVIASANIVYGRRVEDPALAPSDQATQAQLHALYVRNDITNAIDTRDMYRTPLPSESRSYELTGLSLPANRSHFTFEEIATAGSIASAIAYESVPTAGVEKRLIERVCTLYRSDDLTGALSLGTVESLALPFESYKLAFTPGLLTNVYGANATPAMMAEAGFVHFAGDDQWWIPTGRRFYASDTATPSAIELAMAREHFFATRCTVDPFGNSAKVDRDHYDLLMTEAHDPLSNRMVADNDYRVLAPRLVTEPNGNRIAASFDALGGVAGTAVMGKVGEVPRRGDLLDGFIADLSEDVVLAHLADPTADPESALGRATTRLLYDAFAYYRTRDEPHPSPITTYTLARETHDADLSPGAELRFQYGFSYNDGFGREIQKKAPADPTLTGSTARWIGSGWTIFNHQGKPVRRFEPFYSNTHRFEPDAQNGVGPTLFYDPLGRPVATLHPDHTWEKIVIDAWRHETWDVNDTVAVADPTTDPDIGTSFAQLDVSEYLPTWYAARATGALGAEAKAAAVDTAIHAATPTVSHCDALQRDFLTVLHDRFQRGAPPTLEPAGEEFHETRAIFDIEGNQRAVVDAGGRTAMRWEYDMLGNRRRQESMESGARRTLADVAGNLVHSWDSLGRHLRLAYDALRRPITTFLTRPGLPEIELSRTEYGESRPNPEAHNLRGQPVLLYDQSGRVTYDDYDFQGRPLRTTREVATTYRDELDWSAAVPPTLGEALATGTTYDALGRPVTVVTADGSLHRSTFGPDGRLAQLDVNLQGAPSATAFIESVAYNARGQREKIAYGNGATSTYTYDPLTFQLASARTTRPPNTTEMSALFADAATVQDLRYTYDPIGNITHVEDAALATVFYNNAQVAPVSRYRYDSVYRLIHAEGREHVAQTALDFAPPSGAYRDLPFVGLRASPNDLQALRGYRQDFRYDEAGNVLELAHATSGGRWTRSYTYQEASQLESARFNNRVSKTSVGGNDEVYRYLDADGNDHHGCITAINNMPMAWDAQDHLQRVDLGGGGTAYYVYDGNGRRVRKVIERQNGTLQQDRLYLSGLEICREYDGSGTTVKLQRERLHVECGGARFAMVETLVVSPPATAADPAPVVRYQISDHLGSVFLELDIAGRLVSFEQYHPSGTTAFQARGSGTEVSLKRYRYSGMERDEETGFAYHGARYYLPWLVRWASCDPIGIEGGVNLYAYCRNNPVRLNDPGGTDPPPPDAKITESQTGPILTHTERLDREDIHQVLVKTFNSATGAHTQTLYRHRDGQGWLDASHEALRDDLRHNAPTPTKELFVEWNMPSLKSDADKVRDIEGPGLMWGFGLFVVRPMHYAYLKDQTIGIKSPYLHLMGSAKQQTFRAHGEVNQQLEAFALTSIAPELPGAVGGIGRAAGAVSKLGKVGVFGDGSEGLVTLFRGVNNSHAKFAEQSQGVVRPNRRWWQVWKRSSSALEHNTGRGGTLNSPVTSWTTDPRVAVNYALRPQHTRGVVITARVPISKITASPNLHKIMLLIEQEWVSEAEVLVRGTVRGVTRWVP